MRIPNTAMKRDTEEIRALNNFNEKGVLSHYTDGFTEGCNNKIKVLKRNAYVYKNFRRFRNRILHIFSHKQQNKEQAAAY